MANEYKLYTDGLELLHAGTDDLLLYSCGLELVYTVPKIAFSYVSGLEIVHTVPDPAVIFVSGIEVVRSVAFNDPPDIDLVFISDDSDALPFIAVGASLSGVSNSTQTTPFEWNPFRPDVPVQIAESDSDVYEYMREQAELVRQQHNVTQAGDTTFPWQMVLTPGDTEVHTLGSMSRFKHEFYGLIEARYVRVSDHWREQIAAVAGHDFRKDAWNVTNEAARTNSWRLVGVVAPSDSDVRDRYGWALTRGVGPFTLVLRSATQPQQGQSFTWDAAGYPLVGAGPILGRVIGAGPFGQLVDLDDPNAPEDGWIIPEGMWSLDVGSGVTDEYIAGLTSEEFASILERLDELEAALDPEDFDPTDLQNQINTLRVQLQAEENQRRVGDQGLNVRVTALEALDLSGSISDAEFAALEGRVTVLESQIATQLSINSGFNLRLNALEAYQITVGGQISDLYALIASLNTQIINLANSPQIWMPVVDGAIPPTFIQNADGNLIYTRVE